MEVNVLLLGALLKRSTDSSPIPPNEFVNDICTKNAYKVNLIATQFINQVSNAAITLKFPFDITFFIIPLKNA